MRSIDSELSRLFSEAESNETFQVNALFSYPCCASFSDQLYVLVISDYGDKNHSFDKQIEKSQKHKKKMNRN